MGSSETEGTPPTALLNNPAARLLKLLRKALEYPDNQPAFHAWAPPGVVVHDDGTRDEDDRLGAIGDLAFVLERAGWEGDDLLVIAGDNLFDFSLADFVAFWRARGETSALALHDVRCVLRGGRFAGSSG